MTVCPIEVRRSRLSPIVAKEEQNRGPLVNGGETVAELLFAKFEPAMAETGIVERGRRMTDQTLQNDEQEGVPPAQVEGSPSQVAEIVGAAVTLISQRWLRTAVAVAGAVKSGKPFSNGALADLRELREKYEELERARLVLNNMADKTTAKPSEN